MKKPLSGLYAITDSTLMPDTQTMLESVTASLKGGARIIQYRDKSNDQRLRLEQAKRLNELCRDYQIPLLINDDYQLAAAVGAAGVHLGQSDGAVSAARKFLGGDAIIGVTCHDSLQLAQKARQEGADYLAFGAFFPSKTKPEAIPAPLSLLAQAKKELDLPIVAIGGISVDNATQIINAGADMVAVIHALYGQDDIFSTAQQFTGLFSN